MGREIELKLPLSDQQYDFVRSVITGAVQAEGVNVCSDCERLLKSDEYYSRYTSREESKAAGEPQVIRIRGEVSGAEAGAVAEAGAGGESDEMSASGRFYFCIKRKSIENGIELNREDETLVENPEVIRDILNISGYHKFFEKKKDALSVYCTSDKLPDLHFHLELEIVNHLKYIEVEVTEEDCPADKVRQSLEVFISLFGLNAQNRDSRSWMEILS